MYRGRFRVYVFYFIFIFLRGGAQGRDQDLFFCEAEIAITDSEILYLPM